MLVVTVDVFVIFEKQTRTPAFLFPHPLSSSGGEMGLSCTYMADSKDMEGVEEFLYHSTC